MESFNLLGICAVAFVAVFLLLSILALIMKAIIVVFPQKVAGVDAVVVAAVSSVVSIVYPGTKITRIEEIK